jgi:hypothetical protein
VSRTPTTPPSTFGVTVHLDAPPPPLAPHQRRAAEARRIAYLHRHPFVGDGVVPQRTQPVIDTVVSISMTTSAVVSVTARTRNPSSPSSASASAVPSLIVRDLLVVAAVREP